MIDIKTIENKIRVILSDIREIRHTLHMEPEIAMKEFNTSALIRRELQNLDVDILPPFLETDVVAIMKGAGYDETGGSKKMGRDIRKKEDMGDVADSKNVTLRADIDALPLQEKTGLAYASKIDGMMHACGHDGHTAMLIGAARVLSDLKEDFTGSIRFVFQPGEEEVAGGKDLVDAGVLLDPVPDVVYALHGSALFDVGTIAGIEGVASSASDFFQIKIKGKGAHGARPDKGNNPILIGSKLVEMFQQIPSNRFSPFESVVVTVCEFSSGHNANVIPESAILKGTVRSFSTKQSETIKKMITDHVEKICKTYDAAYEIQYRQAYIPIVNAKSAIMTGKEIVQKRLHFNWVDEKHPSMGGEDFSFYLVDHPGAMFSLGLGRGRALGHHPEFDFNDDALFYGILFFVVLALDALGGLSAASEC